MPLMTELNRQSPIWNFKAHVRSARLEYALLLALPDEAVEPPSANLHWHIPKVGMKVAAVAVCRGNYLISEQFDQGAGQRTE